MTTIYVGGSSQYSTIQEGIAAAEQSDATSIIINAGYYTGDTTISSQSGLTVSAAPGADVTIDGHIILTNAASTTLSGLNFLVGGSNIAISATDSDALTITNDTFSSASGRAAVQTYDAMGNLTINGAVTATGSAEIVVTGNTFNNTDDAVLLDNSNSANISSNIMTNSTDSAVEAKNDSFSASISNNIIDGTGASGTAGAIWLHGANKASISHNQITDSAGAGISLSDFEGTTATQNNNAQIFDNYLNDVDMRSEDSGAIYILGRSQNLTDDFVTQNYIGTTGIADDTNNPHAVGIYLDDNASGVTVSENIVQATAVMTDPWEIHGGSNNIFSGNIFDLGTGETDFGLFQSDAADQQPLGSFHQLQSDSITGNIYVTESKTPHNPGFADLIDPGVSSNSITPPTITISGNDFWAFSGAILNVAGAGATGDEAATYNPPAALDADSLGDYGKWSYTDKLYHFMLINTAAIGLEPTVVLTTGPTANNAQNATLGTVTPANAADVIAVTLTSDADFGTGSSIALNGGSLIYTPGLVTAAKTGSDVLKYTISDTTSGVSFNETQTVMLSNGPVPTLTLTSSPSASSAVAATLGTAAPGTGNDALTVTLTSDADFATGSSVTLSNGNLIYMPGTITAAKAGSDTLKYTVTDTVTGAVTHETQNVTLVAGAPTVVLAASPTANNAQTATLGIVIPPNAADTTTVTLTSDAIFASGSLIAITGGNLIYTPGLVTAAKTGSDLLNYTVADATTGTFVNETQTVTLSNGPSPAVILATAPSASSTRGSHSWYGYAWHC